MVLGHRRDRAPLNFASTFKDIQLAAAATPAASLGCADTASEPSLERREATLTDGEPGHTYSVLFP
jgi:hypothetical protein